jgi:sulfate adenylyltransferase subunit 1
MEAVDLSLLTDGLQAEREQGITIDVAYRYFSTGTRKFIIADSPGHEQYTRNMVTAASTANLAIILIDARRGVLAQTRRHSYLAKLVDIPHIVVAINKMDLIDHDRATYDRICGDYSAFAAEIGLADVRFIPVSALNGDNIVDPSEAMDWYAGPTVLEVLEAAPAAHTERAEAFRFPVQYVCRPQASDDPELHDYRGFMGRVESGSVKVGDRVTALPSGQASVVRRIELGAVALPEAIHEQSVSILLEDEIDVSRGDMLVLSDDQPTVTKEVEGMICWFSETPLSPARTYLVHHTTRTSKAKVAGIDYRVDVNTLAQEPVTSLAMNDIARIRLRMAQPLAVDVYAENRATGAFIVIDESTNNTVGAGMIVAAGAAA